MQIRWWAWLLGRDGVTRFWWRTGLTACCSSRIRRSWTRLSTLCTRPRRNRQPARNAGARSHCMSRRGAAALLKQVTRRTRCLLCEQHKQRDTVRRGQAAALCAVVGLMPHCRAWVGEPVLPATQGAVFSNECKGSPVPGQPVCQQCACACVKETKQRQTWHATPRAPDAREMCSSRRR